MLTSWYDHQYHNNLNRVRQNLQNDLSIQRRFIYGWASTQSDQSLRCPPENNFGPLLPIKRTAKSLIRLGKCPAWSVSSLGAQIILLVSSCSGSIMLAEFVNSTTEIAIAVSTMYANYEMHEQLLLQASGLLISGLLRNARLGNSNINTSLQTKTPVRRASVLKI